MSNMAEVPQVEAACFEIAVGAEVDYDWTLCGAGHKYGLLADILGGGMAY